MNDSPSDSGPTPDASSVGEIAAGQTTQQREISGSKIILGIFLFAMTLSAGLWVYTYLHGKPFRPLQHAIHVEFPKTYPRVEGGQKRMHKGTPRILRITLQSPFDPESPDNRPQADQLVARLRELTGQHMRAEDYDVLEVHLVQIRPEQTARKLTIMQPMSPDRP